MSQHIVEIKDNRIIKTPYYLIGDCNFDYIDANGKVVAGRVTFDTKQDVIETIEKIKNENNAKDFIYIHNDLDCYVDAGKHIIKYWKKDDRNIARRVLNLELGDSFKDAIIKLRLKTDNIFDVYTIRRDGYDVEVQVMQNDKEALFMSIVIR